MNPTGRFRKVSIGEQAFAYRKGTEDTGDRYVNKTSVTLYEYTCECGNIFEARQNQNKTNCGCKKKPSVIKVHTPRFRRVRAERPDAVCKSCTPKLTWTIAQAIRTATGSRKEIAEKFSVSQATVSNVMNFKTWKDSPIGLSEEDTTNTGE